MQTLAQFTTKCLFATLTATAALNLALVVGCDNAAKDTSEKSMRSGMDADKSASRGGGMRDGMKADTKAPGDIIDVATGPGMSRVTTLVAAVQAANLVGTLKGPGPFTVFAPTNEAFAKLPPGTVENLLKPENKEKLRAILLHHVHVGVAVPAANVRTMSLSTASGQSLNVVVDGSNVMVSGAKVIKTDVQASNGVIHWIDTVVLP